MAYVTNSYAVRVRRMAVNDVKVRGMSLAAVGRTYGVTRSAVYKWVQRASKDHREIIRTLSSKPHHHPSEVPPQVVARVLALREEHQRCAPVIHQYALQEGIEISVSSVGRILQRAGATARVKKASWRTNPHRPLPTLPGELVAMDTMHVMKADFSRFYIYAVIDICSRMGYAEYQPRMLQEMSVGVALHAQQYFGFSFKMMQTDNGPEFGQSFTRGLSEAAILHRHTRVRRPNDNAHIERFIRTLQEECFKRKEPKETTAAEQLKEYLTYYNTKRFHLGINLPTPAACVSKLLN